MQRGGQDMKTARWTGLFCLWMAAGAQPLGANVEPTIVEPRPYTIIYVPPEDAEMNRAIEAATSTLPQFYARLASPQRGDDEFMIKFDILPGDDTEFVWATDLDRSRLPMTGRLLNRPEHTDHRIGQRVTIAEADIIDWTYRRGRVMQGGYTNRVLLERMPPDEAETMRAYLGW